MPKLKVHTQLPGAIMPKPAVMLPRRLAIQKEKTTFLQTGEALRLSVTPGKVEKAVMVRPALKQPRSALRLTDTQR